MSTDIELAYLAGLFDGEGTIGLVYHNHRRNRVPYASVASTSPELLYAFRDHFGGVLRSRPSSNPNWKDAFEWKVTYDRALVFVAAIRPFMREASKIARGDLLLAEWKAVTPRNGKYTADQRAAKANLEKRFFEIAGSKHLLNAA